MAGHSDNARDLPDFGEADAAPRIAMVIAAYYTKIAKAQIEAASGVLTRAGVPFETIEVPGSLEIAPAIGIANRLGDFEGFVALGCVIRGATSHYDVVVNESARGITMLTMAGVPVGNGIITVENMDQAEERADAQRLNTAGGAAEAALHLVALARNLKEKAKGIGFASGRGA